MKERPILFSAPMVRAILEGRKTQTRRVVKPQPRIDEWGNFLWHKWNFGQNIMGDPHIQAIASPIPNSRTKRVHCPYGKPADRLWVRETHCFDPPDDGTWPYVQWAGCRESSWRDIPPRLQHPRHVLFAATWKGDPLRMRPSIHMPRWASRINLEVTGVRVERLQEISLKDTRAEGCEVREFWLFGQNADERNATAAAVYRQLWESINGPESWDANPWVWVVEFKRIDDLRLPEKSEARTAHIHGNKS